MQGSTGKGLGREVGREEALHQALQSEQQGCAHRLGTLSRQSYFSALCSSVPLLGMEVVIVVAPRVVMRTETLCLSNQP
jgi:hypothetical protein